MGFLDIKPGDLVTTSGHPAVYIRFKGVWDMEDLHQAMAEWFREKKYKFYERIYKHKHPSPFGVEQQWIWEAKRNEEDWVQFTIMLYWHTYDVHDIEVIMPDGSKKTLTKGRIWLEFRGYITFDYKGRFQKAPFYAQLMNFYNKYVILKKNEQLWWDLLWYREIHQLHELVKERLKLESQGY